MRMPTAETKRTSNGGALGGVRQDECNLGSALAGAAGVFVLANAEGVCCAVLASSFPLSCSFDEVTASCLSRFERRGARATTEDGDETVAEAEGLSRGAFGSDDPTGGEQHARPNRKKNLRCGQRFIATTLNDLPKEFTPSFIARSF